MYDRSLAYAPVSMSLASVSRPLRVPAMRQYYASSCNAREVEPLREAVPEADITMVPLPGAGVEFGEICGVAVWQRASPALRKRDGVLFLASADGFLHEGAGCERRRFGAGEILVTTFSNAPRISFDRRAAMKSVWVDRRRLEALLPGVDLARLRAVHAAGIGPDMLFDYAAALVREAPLGRPMLRLAAAHLTELAALVVTAADQRAGAAVAGGRRAQRLAAIKDDMARMFRLPAFSVTTVAQKHGISPRYVQKLFEESGTTFTEHVRMLRLELAGRLLADPGYQRVRISEIAFEAGFSNLGNFNRLFRGHYGRSPSMVRAGHRHAARRASGVSRSSGSRCE